MIVVAVKPSLHTIVPSHVLSSSVSPMRPKSDCLLNARGRILHDNAHASFPVVSMSSFVWLADRFKAGTMDLEDVQESLFLRYIA